MSKKMTLETIIQDSKVNWTKELLHDLYIKKGYSLPDFENKFGMNTFRTTWLLDFFNIKRRSISEANQSEKRQSKFKKTCKKKYGVKNVSQLDTIKKKKADTFMKHYGVDNIWKSKEYYDWLYDYMTKKYGKKSVPNINGTHHPHKNLSKEPNLLIKPCQTARLF